MMRIHYNGNDYPLIAQDKLTPGEIDAIERATGLTFQKIRRMGETCVCEHGMRAHTHKDADGVQTDDASCTECGCEQHASDMPTRVSTAFMWISVRRGCPTVKFADLSDCPTDGLVSVDDEADAVDPTVPPQPEASPI